MAARIRKRRENGRRQARTFNRSGYQVFVSHASTDKWLAKALCKHIEGIGAVTFRDDRDVESGDDIPDNIRRELIGSQELVILVTPDSVNRPWVLLEAGAFWGRRKGARIVAVLCHVAIDSIPDMIKTKKAISINDVDAYLHELARRVRARNR